jgi:hypothetical protein
LNISASRTNLCSIEFNLCCLSANVALPANSALCKEIMLSMITSLA